MVRSIFVLMGFLLSIDGNTDVPIEVDGHQTPADWRNTCEDARAELKMRSFSDLMYSGRVMIHLGGSTNVDAEGLNVTTPFDEPVEMILDGSSVLLRKDKDNYVSIVSDPVSANAVSRHKFTVLESLPSFRYEEPVSFDRLLTQSYSLSPASIICREETRERDLEIFAMLEHKTILGVPGEADTAVYFVDEGDWQGFASCFVSDKGASFTFDGTNGRRRLTIGAKFDGSCRSLLSSGMKQVSD